MARPVALLLAILLVATIPVGAATLADSTDSGTAASDGAATRQTPDLTDVTVTASPTVEYQRATWTFEATVPRNTTVTAIDLTLPGDSPANVTTSDVRSGYKPPVNATFVMAGSPERVIVQDNGSLRLTYPDGIELQNGSRLTVEVTGPRVPADDATAGISLRTNEGVLAGSGGIDPKPVPHIGFYRMPDETGVHLRYGVARGVSMFAVVLHEGEVVGTKYIDAGYAITMDGEGMAVEGVSGPTELTIRAYADVNQNGFFDPNVDRPYVDRTGDPIGQTAEIILAETTTAPTGSTTTTSVSHESPTPSSDPVTTSTPTTTTPIYTPGFGVGVSLLAVFAGLVLLVRE